MAEGAAGVIIRRCNERRRLLNIFLASASACAGAACRRQQGGGGVRRAGRRERSDAEMNIYRANTGGGRWRRYRCYGRRLRRIAGAQGAANGACCCAATSLAAATGALRLPRARCCGTALPAPSRRMLPARCFTCRSRHALGAVLAAHLIRRGVRALATQRCCSLAGVVDNARKINAPWRDLRWCGDRRCRGTRAGGALGGRGDKISASRPPRCLHPPLSTLAARDKQAAAGGIRPGEGKSCQKHLYGAGGWNQDDGLRQRRRLGGEHFKDGVSRGRSIIDERVPPLPYRRRSLLNIFFARLPAPRPSSRRASR